MKYHKLIRTYATGFGAVYTEPWNDVGELAASSSQFQRRIWAICNDVRINDRPYSAVPGTASAVGCWSFAEDLKQ